MQAEQQHQCAKSARRNLIGHKAAHKHRHALGERHAEAVVVIRLKRLSTARERCDAIEILANNRAQKRIAETEFRKHVARENLHAHRFEKPIAHNHEHRKHEPRPAHARKGVGHIFALACEKQVTNEHAECENAQHDIEQTPFNMGPLHGRFGSDFVEQIRLENRLFKWLFFLIIVCHGLFSRCAMRI